MPFRWYLHGFDFLLIKSNPNTILMVSKMYTYHIGTFSSKRMVTFTAPPGRAAGAAEANPKQHSGQEPPEAQVRCSFHSACPHLTDAFLITGIAIHWLISLSNPDHSERKKGLWNSHPLSLIAIAQYVSLQSSAAYQGCGWRRFGIPRYRAEKT